MYQNIFELSKILDSVEQPDARKQEHNNFGKEWKENFQKEKNKCEHQIFLS